MAGRRAGGRNRGAMVAALSAADNDRAVLDGQFDRSACGARSGAARSRAARAIGVVCIHRIQIMAHARSTKPLQVVTTGKWTRVTAACSDPVGAVLHVLRSDEHTSELQSLMRISYAGFCLKKKNKKI